MAPDAATLRCPACGANVAPDAGRCRYCRARLATISCPACFALMFDTATYCQQCGARRDRADGEAAAATCPACRQEMRRVAVGGTRLLECRACDAVWLEASDFERICADSEAQAAVLHHVRPASGTRPPRIKYRPCPRCGRMMNRINFGQISGTVIDVCRGHGTLLDAGELHAIVTFIRGGGLDRARQRRLDELKDEERRLEWKRSRAAHGGSPSGPWPESARQRTWGVLDLLELLRGDD
jgi:Zn-finger nucleic acid-binding protein